MLTVADEDDGVECLVDEFGLDLCPAVALDRIGLPGLGDGERVGDALVGQVEIAECLGPFDHRVGRVDRLEVGWELHDPQSPVSLGLARGPGSGDEPPVEVLCLLDCVFWYFYECFEIVRWVCRRSSMGGHGVDGSKDIIAGCGVYHLRRMEHALSIPRIQLLSVIVPTRGRSGKLANLLGGLGQHFASTRADFEVLVVIDGEGDAPEGTSSFSVEIIRTAHIGAGAARNLGIERSRGDAVLFLNDDVVPSEGFIDAHVEALNTGHRAVLGDSAWVEPESPIAFDQFIAHSPAIFDRRGLVDGQRYGFGHGWTLNLSLRREVIDGLGQAFDPGLRPIYFEDIEFVYRCFGADSEVVFCADARAVHDHRVSVREYFAREVLLGMMSVVFYETNPACYGELFELDPHAHARVAHEMLGLDVRDHRRVLDRFVALAAEPARSDDPAGQAMVLYDLHLPIKRRAFRVGLCAMCAQAIEWDQRISYAGRLLDLDPVLGALPGGA